MHLMPELCKVPSAVRPLKAPEDTTHRVRALDVGAGVGRVTSDVLLHLVDDVVLIEPVEKFVQEAFERGTASAAGTLIEDKSHAIWKGIRDKSKSVTFVQGTLQALDPAHPLASEDCKLLGRVGHIPSEDDIDSKFDVIWCQWCLGHLTDDDLVPFFKRCRAALRESGKSLIIVKENLCQEAADGTGRESFDESDSSLTRYSACPIWSISVLTYWTFRSDGSWKRAFRAAGLTLVHEQIQHGFPEGLYEVRM